VSKWRVEKGKETESEREREIERDKEKEKCRKERLSAFVLFT
jgi:hypothetical protein